MYNIIQLNDKNLSELQAIAQELGIKKTDSLKKEELVYKILDEQAIAGATKKVAADKLKEERKEDKKKTLSGDSKEGKRRQGFLFYQEWRTNQNRCQNTCSQNTATT